jgi:hypothetical protein
MRLDQVPADEELHLGVNVLAYFGVPGHVERIGTP